jgi:Ca2+-binding EF-hand superfamily protein
MKLLSFAAIGTIALTFSLSAEELKPTTFSIMDKDGDGYISIVEATGNAELIRDWAKFDLDNDGKIEVSEFSAFESKSGGAENYVPPEDLEPGAAPR